MTRTGLYFLKRILYQRSFELKKTIKVKKKLFEFLSHTNWVCKATFLFARACQDEKISSKQTICIDQEGTVCYIGKQFNKAVYPVEIFMI